MNRGSLSRRGADAPSPTRFNEAPIHESGKFVLGRDLPCAVPASMRPRFMNRGSARHGSQGTGDRSRFNEAPIHESGK